MPSLEAPTIDDIYMTAQELAARWRIDPASLANQRSRGEGIPFHKIAGGAVRYRVADVIEAEAARRFGLTFDSIDRALASAPWLDAATRAKVVAHLRKELAG